MDFRTYKNKEYNIQFKYPATWERGESQLGALVVLYTPSLEKGFFRENLSFMVYQLANADTSIEDYLSQNLQQMEKTFGEVQKIKRKSKKLGGYKGYLSEYISGFGDQKFHIRKFAIKVQNVIYIFSHTYLASQESKHIKSVNNIIKSFEFLE
ncbi:MAG: hypothetical protein ACOC44_18635 [Promethearchaeia archaeon]